MPILYIHGVLQRLGEDKFREQTRARFAQCGIPADEVIPVYWGDHASRLSLNADEIRSLPRPWVRPRAGSDALVTVSSAPSLLSITPLIPYLSGLGVDRLVTIDQVRERLGNAGDQLIDIDPDPAVGTLRAYAQFQALESVDWAFADPRVRAPSVPPEDEPPLPPAPGAAPLFGIGESTAETEAKVKRRLAEVIGSGLQEGAQGHDYSRGLLNFNLKEFLGNAIAGIVGSLAEVGGFGWAVKWLARKLSDAAYTRWLKDWVKSLMKWLNDKLMGILDGVLGGLHRAIVPNLGNFIGDVFVYLRAEGQEVQTLVSNAYRQARTKQEQQQQQGRPSKLYVVAHSLGGILAYDLIINRGGKLRDDSRPVDKFITFGSQVGLFHEIDPASGLQAGAEAMIDLAPYVDRWLNVYHEMDFLGFSVDRIFTIGPKGSGKLEEKSVPYTGLVTTSADGAVLQVGVDFKAEGFNPHSGYWADDDFLPILREALRDYPTG
jgi:hypothetical protein